MFNIDEVMEKRLDQFDRITAKSREIFNEKNRKYQDAVRDTGVNGAVVEFVGLTGRLKALVLRNETHGRDSIQELVNALMDAQVYSYIALMMVEDENWEGV